MISLRHLFTMIGLLVVLGANSPLAGQTSKIAALHADVGRVTTPLAHDCASVSPLFGMRGEVGAQRGKWRASMSYARSAAFDQSDCHSDPLDLDTGTFVFSGYQRKGDGLHSAAARAGVNVLRNARIYAGVGAELRNWEPLLLAGIAHHGGGNSRFTLAAEFQIVSVEHEEWEEVWQDHLRVSRTTLHEERRWEPLVLLSFGIEHLW